jgi:hypothetical protein
LPALLHYMLLHALQLGVGWPQVHHLRPPAAYLAANWPLRHAALSADGGDLAVAGRRGLALFARRSARWRLFGDISQERSLAVQVLIRGLWPECFGPNMPTCRLLQAHVPSLQPGGAVTTHQPPASLT